MGCFGSLELGAAVTLPDEMHLDQKDQAAFTRGLVDALRANGVLRGRE